MEITKWSLMKRRYSYLDILNHGVSLQRSMHGEQSTQIFERSLKGSKRESARLTRQNGFDAEWGESPFASVNDVIRAFGRMGGQTL